MLLSAFVGFMASTTTLGFWSGFLFSIILTPIIGFIIFLFYPSKEKQQQRIKREEAVLQQQQQQTALLQNLSSKTPLSISDELSKLKKQMDDGVITADEFQKLKSKLIAS
jgi:Flp pilus assembly protein TadB